MVSTRKTAHPDAPTVIAFAGEMATSTQTIIDGLNFFAASPKAKPISAAVESISETAKLISLRTVTLLGEEIAHLAKQMEASEGPAVQSEADAVRGALTAMHRYLVSATSGKLGSGLSVNAAYTELTRSSPGRTALNRGEIFLPVFAMFGNNSSTYNEGKFVAEIARYQDEFHQALLRYNQNKNFDTINAMRTTLVTMETKNPPAEFRMFFSLAIAYFDIALRASGKIAKEDEGLLTRIDRELADIVRGDLEVSESTLSWFLYVIAQAAQFSARIKSFQESYELTRMIEQEPSGVVSDQTLSSARTTLDNARRTWEAAMVKNGEVKAAKSSTFALAAVCNTIGDHSLKTLSFAMGALADGVATEVVPVNPETAVFGASILLALGDRIESIMSDPKGGRAVADFHKDRVRQVLSGRKPSELSSHVQAKNGYPQEILDEVHNNVSAAEGIVDLCVREGIKESKSEEAIKLLSAASSAMMLINLMDGAEFADRVTGHVKSTLDQLQAKETVSEENILLMAEAVMLLDRYIRLIAIDEQQAALALKKGMDMFETSEEEIPASTSNEDEGPFETLSEDEDGLGEIFYEEARGVFQDMLLPSLEALSTNLNDDSAFQILRRGFHTIKGSARMVGLMGTGDVAQHAEHALNIIRENKSIKLVPDMLVWLKDVATLIHQTVGHLEAGTPAKLDQAPHKAIYDAFAQTFVFSLTPGAEIPQTKVEAPVAIIVAPAKPTTLELVPESVRTVPQFTENVEPAAEAPVASADEPTKPMTRELVPESVKPASEDTVDVHTHDVDLVRVENPKAEDPLSEDVSIEVAATTNAVAPQEADPVVAPAAEIVKQPKLEMLDAPGAIVPDAEVVQVGIEKNANLQETEAQETAVSVAGQQAPTETPAMQFDLSETVPSEIVSVVDEHSASQESLSEKDPAEKSLEFNLAEAPPDPEGPPEIPESMLAQEVRESAAEMPASNGDSNANVNVGDLQIMGSIYRSFLEESEQFYNDLERLLRQMIAGERKQMDFEVIRLSHSLAGMGRTTGLKAITEVAGNLESWATLKQDHQLNLDAETTEVLRDTLEALEMMLVGVRDQIEPMSDHKLVARLKALVEKEEHMLAHGKTENEMTSSVMERIEAGGEISDSGPHTASPTTAEKAIAKKPAVKAEIDNATVGLAVNTPEAAGFRFRQEAQPQSLDEAGHLVEELPLPLSSKTLHGVSPGTIDAAFQNAGGESTVQIVPESLNRPAETYDAVSQDVLDEIAAVYRNTVPVIPESALVIDDSVSPSPESTSFPATVDMSELGTRHGEQDDLDEVPVTQEFADQMAAEADALASSPNHGMDAFEGEDRVDVVPYDNLLVTPAKAVVQEVVTFDQESPDVRAIAESLPDVIIESNSLQKPEAIFVAPEQGGHSHVVSIDESLSLVPSSVEMDVGTTTSVSNGQDGQNRTRSQSKPKGTHLWLDIVRGKDDAVDDEMKDIFLEEADERFGEIDVALSTLASDPTNKKLTNSLKRGVHTLKGSANTTGARKIGAIFHYLEDLMNEAPVLNAALCETIQSGVDAAFASVDAMKNGRSIDNAVARLSRQASADATGIIAETIAESAVESNPPSTESLQQSMPSMVATQSSTVSSSTEVVLPDASPARRTAKNAAKEDDSTTLRVSTNTLDRMVKSIGEINISRTRIGMNVDLTKMQMTGLAMSLERMYGYLREIEMEAEKQMHTGGAAAKDSGFDALQMDRFTRLQELTRRVAEAQNDVMTQQGTALGAINDMEDAVATQRILVSDVSGELDRIRQIRVSSMVPNLKRVVRAACNDTSKQGEIYFDADVEIDRGILDKIRGPIEHILRNAVAHGIELPVDRVKAHKDAVGSIEFRAYQDGSEVVIEIHDDGSGIDSGRVLRKAVDKGIVRPGTRMTEDKIRELLFEPGFSTADAVTDIAGRGVGLDVVRSEISAMGGRVEVQSVFGAGTTFVLRLPATLTVIAGVSVLTEKHMYVIPVSFIDRLVRVNAKELDTAYKSQKLIIKETSGEQVSYDFWGLWQVVGMPTTESRVAQRGSILLMRGDRIAVHVDEIRPAAEFVFRPMGPQIAPGSGLIGSTINASGDATLVVDPARVVRNLKTINTKLGNINSDARISTQQQQVRMPLVLIVDDSTTVRKVTTRLLKKEGFRYAEAENGLQALERIQEEHPDVILMDIEMPVMNGYEATQAIRATDEMSDIPIIMITSRVGDSHRQTAFDLGVNDYLGKPYNASDLMSVIRKHTQEILAQQA